MFLSFKKYRSIMVALTLEQIFSSKIELDERPYLDVAIIVRGLIKKGSKIYDEGDQYRFTLSEVMRKSNDLDIKITRKNAAKVVHTIIRRMGFDYFFTSGDGHPKYEIKIEMKKIRELDEWFQEIYTWLGYRTLFS